MLIDFCTVTSASIPYPWRQYEHPNGDIYYYNPQLRLITPEDIPDPVILEYIMDARDDHLQCLEGDPYCDDLPSDYELVVSDVSETAAVLRMYSRRAGAAYDWTEDRGLVFHFHFIFCLDKLNRRVVLQASLSNPRSTFGLTLQNIPHTTYICRLTRRENLSNLLAMVRIYLYSPLWCPLRHPAAEFPPLLTLKKSKRKYSKRNDFRFYGISN